MLRIDMDSVRKYVASQPESGGSKRQSKKNFVVCYTIQRTASAPNGNRDLSIPGRFSAAAKSSNPNILPAATQHVRDSGLNSNSIISSVCFRSPDSGGESRPSYYSMMQGAKG